MIRSTLSAFARRGHPSADGKYRFRPRLETMEDRSVPAHFTVTNPSDTPIPAPGTLRYAVAHANNGDFIDIQTTSPIVLTQGEIYLAKNVTIDSAIVSTASLATISGNNNSRIFEIDPSANVTLVHIRMIEGDAAFGIASTGGIPATEGYGGAILNQGTLALTGCSLQGNTAGNLKSFGEGGGIYNNGVFNRFNTPAVGKLTMTNCLLSVNSSVSGGGIFNGGGTATLFQSSLDHDVSLTDGGGIMNIGGSMTITGSEFDYNSASANGGSVANEAALSAPSATLLVKGSNFRFNNGGQGGAIANVSQGGGAAFSGVFGCGFFNNNASAGAGIDNEDSSSLLVIASKFVQNVATGNGGAINNGSSSTATVLLSQLINNSASQGGGIYNTGVLTLGFSLLQTNKPQNFDNLGTYIDWGFNTFV
jgi:hypothetical protein